MKKLNNKILLIALATLIGIFVLSRIFRSPKLEANMRKELVKVDTSKITEVRVVVPSRNNQEINLVRVNANWLLTRQTKNYPTDSLMVKDLLSAISNIEAQRMVSRKKEKWETYNVGEKAIHVIASHGGKIFTNFYVGKTAFNQSNGGAYTYVRLADEDEVYAVNGYLETTFNHTVADYRDKSFLRLNKDDIAKISFSYPADSSFVLEKKDSLWWMGTQKAEKASVDSYLNQLAFKNFAAFADDFKPTGNADLSITISGSAGVLSTAEAWKKSDTEWIVKSSLQKDVFFLSPAGPVLEIFAGKKKFLPSTK